MSVDAHGESPSPNPETSLVDVMEVFEKKRKTFFEKCKAYSRNPSSKNLKIAAEAGEEMVDAIEEIMYFILEDDSIGISEKAVMLADLLITDDQCRREYFEQLTHKPNVTESLNSEELLAKTYEERLGDDSYDMEKFLDGIEDDYKSDLAHDINRLLEEIDSTPRARSKRAVKTVGKHALDVAKIGAGAYIALRIGR